jgi:acyl-CoA thioester hydrolase
MRPPERAAAAPDPAFRLPVRVYYQDTDAGGVVFHATYLAFLERARTEWLRRLGFDIARMARADRVLFIVREVRVTYVRPALLDDLLQVTVAVQHLGRAQFTLRQQVLRDAELLADASVNLACVSSDALRPLRLPDALCDAVAAARSPAPS